MKKTSDVKRKEAIERQAVYDGLSVVERLERLDAKFGPGQGAKLERKRLAAQRVESERAATKARKGKQ